MKRMRSTPVWHQQIKKLALLPLFLLVFLNALTVVAASSNSYVGNKSTKVYHTSTCTYAEKVSSVNRIYFSSRSSAEQNGYRRCHYCGDDVVESGQNNGLSSGNSSNRKPTTATIPATQPPATADTAQNNAEVNEKSWWDILIEEYSLLVYSTLSLLITVVLYFICEHISNLYAARLLFALMIILGIISIPAAAVIGTFVVFPIGMIFVGISKLIQYIKKRKANREQSNNTPSSTTSSSPSDDKKTVSPNKPHQENIYYMEAANGMTVRGPESKLESWSDAQERQRSDEPLIPQQIEFRKKMHEMFLQDIRSIKHDDSDEE